LFKKAIKNKPCQEHFYIKKAFNLKHLILLILNLIGMQNYLFKLIYIVLLVLFVDPLIAQNNISDYFDEEYAIKDNPGYQTNNAAQLFKEGNSALYKGDYELAIRYFNKATANRNRFVDAYFARALAHERLRNYKHAIADCDTVINFDPQNSEAFFKRAVLKYQVKDYVGAITDLSHLLNMENLYTNAVFFKGVQTDVASEPSFSGIISMYSQQADIYNQRGLAKKALGDKEGALEDLNNAVSLNKEDPLLFVNRGTIKKELGDEKGAAQDFTHALALDPGNELALYNLTTGMSGKNKSSELIASYDRVIAINPEMSSAFINRGTAKHEMGDYKGAQEDFTRAIDLNPEEHEAFLNRGLSKEKLKNFKGALDDYNQALKLVSNDYRAYKYRGNVFFQTRNYKNAVEEYTLAIGLFPYDGGSYYNRGLARYYLSRETDESCADLKKAFEMGIEQAAAAIEKYCR
jgi:tetratricopeptide (TPR) repeat protein